MTTDDVRNAADVLRPQWEASDGVDGRVSIEVDPRLAHDTDKTVAQAIELWKIVDRPNILIKIPATKAGLPAITSTLAEGISVNVTLIFSVERHREVMDAYLAGLEAAKAAGHDLSKIHSVASFFVSRVDTELDKRLVKLRGQFRKEALTWRDHAASALGGVAIACLRVSFADGRDRHVGLSHHSATALRIAARDRTTQRPWPARPALPTPALLTRRTRKCSSVAIVSHRSKLTAHGYSGRCGHRPA